LVGVFATLLAFGLQFVWQTRTGFPPEAPPDFLEIEKHLRVFAWVSSGISAIGLGLALSIFRGWRWGYHALASLVSLTAVGAAAIRVSMPPRVVVDPDWPQVVALSLMAALCWHRAIMIVRGPS
jgi:hypothetical protein